MLAPLGFAWLAYNYFKNGLTQLENFSYSFDFSDSFDVIGDYLHDTNNLLTYLKNIGSGIGTIFTNLPPLIIYFMLVAIIITVLGLMIRIVIDIL